MASFAAQEQENKQIVRQFFELLDRHDTERIGQLLVSNTHYSFHIGGMPSPVDWIEHKRLLAGVNNAFPDLHHEIVDMVAEGDKVAIRLSVNGTHKEEFQGIPPTGKKLSLDEMGFITIIDGKITEGWISADTMRLKQQLGALPPSSPANTSSSTPSSS
ncbi:MAG TPA: ester cyclase [Nitrososphaeraceae archaeon]|nr:ester cyclase [Nitrososphaeraceae archaeon]